MHCGISTASFYPQTPVEALTFLAGAGVQVTEVFINTFSELEDDYLARMKHVLDESGMAVSSLHPFTGVMEGLLFASAYQSRYDDGVRLYRRYFEVCRALGADKLVFHGDHHYNTRMLPNEAYAPRFLELSEVGRAYGVTLCHENVAYCRVNSPESARRLRALWGDAAAFVLDTKQVQRTGESLYDMADAMGGAIRQVHLSDSTENHTCLVPGRGDMDMAAFFSHLRGLGYAGDIIIEVYEDNYQSPQELVEALAHIQALAQ